jgi:beta-galactosidase
MKSIAVYRFLRVALAGVALVVVLSAAAGPTPGPHKLTISGERFLLDGKPFQIISGEMHYARVPREYCRARLKMARAMGLNTISTYVFWTLHEPKPGVYDFSGQLDVAEFLREAQEEGLHVILRPGPYVCAEWDLGGLPSWLLADPQIVLRSVDPKFMKPAEIWLMRLGQELAPLQATRGGPIIAVQVENEYGSFDSDKVYLKHIYDLIVAAGFGQSLLYTADGPEQLPSGTLPGVLAVVNFGPGETKEAFAALAKFRPGQPRMAGEYWAGWFDHWGGKHAATDTAEQVRDLKWMLAQGYSVNLYMFHGGTTFGFMNGANFDGEYLPQTTSYDYDAALDESGRPTNKYYGFREAIAAANPAVQLPDVPAVAALISVGPIELRESASLWDNLGTPIASESPKTMEMLGQSYGFILYRTQVAGPIDGELLLGGMHDYAYIFVNGRMMGSLDTRNGESRMTLHSSAEKNQLDILVENGGRINFKKRLREQRKGIAGAVTLSGSELRPWQIYPLPMNEVNSVAFQAAGGETVGPRFWRGQLTLTQTGDTYLDMRDRVKGAAWINGYPLGRFWNRGPQQTLYVPAPWLKTGANEVVIFDINGGSNNTLRGLDRPVYGQ